MPRIVSLTVFQTDLPLRRPFQHAAARRSCSESVFLRCVTDTGTVGFGESLPRSYVTGETRDHVVHILRDQVLPRLLGHRFETWNEVEAFLDGCDGKAPAEWVPPEVPQTAAWCAVDLALLDAFGRQFGQRVSGSEGGGALDTLRYSGVLSAGGR